MVETWQSAESTYSVLKESTIYKPVVGDGGLSVVIMVVVGHGCLSSNS